MHFDIASRPGKKELKEDSHSFLVPHMGHCPERRKRMTSWKGEEGGAQWRYLDKGALCFASVSVPARQCFRTAVLHLQ